MASLVDRDVMLVANVETATPLSDSARTMIVEKLTREVGQPLQVVERIVPSVLGGIRISCAGYVADATVAKQLKDMQAALLSSTGEKGV